MAPGSKRRKASASKSSRSPQNASKTTVAAEKPFVAPTLVEVLTFLIGALTYVTIARGIIYYLPLVQIPLVVGLVIGLLIRARGNAAAVVALVVALGVWLLPPFAVAQMQQGQALLSGAAMALGAAAVAFTVRSLLERGGRSLAAGIAWALTGLLIVNVWATTITLDSRPITEDGRAAVDLLREKPAPGEVWSDEDFYRQVLWLMEDNDFGFYEAFQTGYQQNVRWQRDPNTVLAVRPPTAFLFWAALPAKPWSLIIGYLTLASAAAIAVMWASQRRVRAVFGVPAVSALLGLVLFVASTRMILNTEPWAVLLAIISAAAGLLSLAADRPKRLLLLSVVTATLAVLTRELFVYLLIAGLASALVGPAEKRPLRLGFWLGAFGVVLAGYVLHALSASAIVTATGTAAQWFNGGLDNLLLGLRYATDYIGRTIVVPVVFALLALLGAAKAREGDERVFLLLTCALPLVGFLFFGSDAREISTQAQTNYWGMITVPVLVALSPLGMGALWDMLPAHRNAS